MWHAPGLGISYLPRAILKPSWVIFSRNLGRRYFEEGSDSILSFRIFARCEGVESEWKEKDCDGSSLI
jgi:hypothetical protein